MAESAYSIEARNRVNRLRKRAVYDYEFVHRVINTTPIAHVSFPPSLDADAEPFPALLPMIACMAKYSPGQQVSESEPLDLYLHGYVSSRVMRLSSKSREFGHESGLPLTVSAAINDGLILSLTPFSHSHNYRSAVLQGYGSLVEDPEEKLWAMREITNKVFPERWETSRTPPTPTEMKTTNILKVQVVSASGKHRHGPPNDDKNDMNDLEMRSRVWTGFVPAWEQLGEPQKAPMEEKTSAPDYIQDAIARLNRERQHEAQSSGV